MKSKSPSFLGSFCVSGENNSGDEFGSTLTLRSTLLSETFIIQWCIHMCAVYVVYMIGSSERENFTFTLESQLYSCSCWCCCCCCYCFHFRCIIFIYVTMAREGCKKNAWKTIGQSRSWLMWMWKLPVAVYWFDVCELPTLCNVENVCFFSSQFCLIPRRSSIIFF